MGCCNCLFWFVLLPVTLIVKLIEALFRKR